MWVSYFIELGVLGGSISGLIGGWLGGLTGGIIGGSVSAICLWIMIPRFSIEAIVTPFVAIAMSLIFGVCRDRIEPTEIFRWSWKRAWQWLGWGCGVGLILSIPLLLARTIEVIVLLPLTSLLFMLFGGFTKQLRMGEINTVPNQGIWETGRNALKIGLLATVIYSLISWMILSLNTIIPNLAPSLLLPSGESTPWLSIRASLPFGIIAGMIVGMVMGLVGAEGSGVIVLQHFVLRLLLRQQGRLPWNYSQFLDGCTNRILLQRVGGNYIFIHRLLLEHFANWRPSR